MHCIASRIAAGNERRSSITPTTPNSAAVAVSATNCPPSFSSKAGDVATVAQATTKVATTTDIPPPCGVG